MIQALAESFPDTFKGSNDCKDGWDAVHADRNEKQVTRMNTKIVPGITQLFSIEQSILVVIKREVNKVFGNTGYPSRPVPKDI